MSTRDFQASQIRLNKIIASGSRSAEPQIIIYSASNALNFEGSLSSNMLSEVGSDVFLFVSGNQSVNGAPRDNVTLFGGDVVISGSLFAEKVIIEVEETTTGSLSVSGSLFVSRSIDIKEGLVVNSSLETGEENFFVVKGSSGAALKVDSSLNQVSINPSQNDVDFVVKTPSAQNAIFVDAGNEQITIMGDGTDSLGTDTNVFVSGTVGAVGTTTKGVTVFAGDVVISGSLVGPTGAPVVGTGADAVGWLPGSGGGAGGGEGADWISTTGSIVVTQSFYVDPASNLFSVNHTTNNLGVGVFNPTSKFEIKVDDTEDKAGVFVNFDETGVYTALEVDSEADSMAVDIKGKYPLKVTQDLDDGYGIYASRNVAGAGTNPLVSIVEQNAGNTQPALNVEQSGTGDIIKLVAGATEALSVKSTGKVGIGTNTPSGLLDVKGDGATSQVFILSGSGAATSKDESSFQDVSFFVSGSKSTKGTSVKGTSLFGGDVVISGTLYAERMVMEVESATTGSLAVSGSLFVSQSIQINEGLTVNNSLESGAENFFVVNSSNGEALKVDTSLNQVSVNSPQNDVDFVVKTPSYTSALFVDAGNEQITMLGSSVALGSDVNLFISGAANSKDTSTKGTSVFAGDVVISGSLLDGSGAEIVAGGDTSAVGWFSGSASGDGMGEGANWISTSGSLVVTQSFYANPSNSLFAIDHAANMIGVGTFNPTTKFEVAVADTENISGILVDFNETGVYTALEVDSEADSTAVDIKGKYPLKVTQDHDDGYGIYASRNSANPGTNPLVELVDNGVSSTQTTLKIQQYGTGDILNLYDSSSEVLTVTSAGNLGLGTASPAGLMDIKGDGSTSQVFILSGSGAPASPNESNYQDVAFFVSGSIGSKNTSNKGAAVFGGDVVISGSLSVEGSVPSVKFSGGNGDQYDMVVCDGTGDIVAQTNISYDGSSLNVTGSILPGIDNTYDLGSPTQRYANIYTGDLHLRNDRGHWQIIEESDCLTITNKLSGQRYKFVLEPYLDSE